LFETRKLDSRKPNSFRKVVFIGVGGSFNVLAGNDNRAPKSLIILNLEWLYRIIEKPTRMVLLKDLFFFLA
jgi:N-acetylglucosaminyldiphosphoundecaprenol N-acetyl-beta-D-mannosaminyltransferase